jgi:ribosome biogenesis GTPase
MRRSAKNDDLFTRFRKGLMRDEQLTAPARVISVGRNALWVAFEDSEVLRVASMRKGRERMSLVVGDVVVGRALEDGRVLVERREPRSFALVRRTGSGRQKTMAANIDGIAIVAALADPPFHAAMVDELLAFSEIHEIAASLVLTKPDLADAAEREWIESLYSSLGYRTLVLNPKARVGLDELERVFASRHTLLIGQSGVGKSSIFRALGGEASVGEVSKIGRGRQTTSAGRLHRFPEGFLIDSPGVSDFELHGMAAADVAGGFVEFAPLLGHCRFTDCAHVSEPGCAIREAVDAGRIAGSRYASFRAIVARETKTY